MQSSQLITRRLETRGEVEKVQAAFKLAKPFVPLELDQRLWMAEYIAYSAPGTPDTMDAAKLREILPATAEQTGEPAGPKQPVSQRDAPDGFVLGDGHLCVVWPSTLSFPDLDAEIEQVLRKPQKRVARQQKGKSLDAREHEQEQAGNAPRLL